MSAVAAVSALNSPLSRRFTELEASKEMSRVASSGNDVTTVIESVVRIALRVNGIKRIQIDYSESVSGTAQEPFVWGSMCEEGAVASAVATIGAGQQRWGELRLYFELQPSTLESPLRFAKFLAQQIGLQLSRWSLNLRSDELKEQIEQLRKIVEKRKAIQRARAIPANTRQISDAEALQVMRQYSRESGRTLHQVADAFIFGDAQKWTVGRYVQRRRSLRSVRP